MLEKNEVGDVENVCKQKRAMNEDRMKEWEEERLEPSECQPTRPAHSSGLVPPAIVSRDRSSS